MNRLILTLTLLLAGCGSTMDLDEQFRPLEQIRESKVVATGLGKSGARTIGETVYVKDLDAFLEANPEPLLTGTLLHERRHAQRQEEDGIARWLARYAVEPGFMWDEEKLGWYEHIKYIRANGKVVSPEAVAAALSNYKTVFGKRMVSYAEAIEWARAVLSGSWTPQ